jgi:hypothetical protein
VGGVVHGLLSAVAPPVAGLFRCAAAASGGVGVAAAACCASRPAGAPGVRACVRLYAASQAQPTQALRPMPASVFGVQREGAGATALDGVERLRGGAGLAKKLGLKNVGMLMVCFPPACPRPCPACWTDLVSDAGVAEPALCATRHEHVYVAERYVHGQNQPSWLRYAHKHAHARVLRTRLPAHWPAHMP